MPARAVQFVADGYYHIYNRGSEKRIIFLSPRDYNSFLTRLKDNTKKFAIDILAYCLMPNHYHLLLKQTSDTSITNCMNAIQLGFAKFFNTKYERIGPLFQGRFKAKIVENDQYLLYVSAYIHRNPIADQLDSGNSQDSRNLLERLRYYEYSSYQDYLRPNEAPRANARGTCLRRQVFSAYFGGAKSAEAENTSHSSLGLRPRFSAKADKKALSKPNAILDYFSKNNPKLSYQAFVETFNPDFEDLAPILFF